jgi:hypothetical protein
MPVGEAEKNNYAKNEYGLDDNVSEGIHRSPLTQNYGWWIT